MGLVIDSNFVKGGLVGSSGFVGPFGGYVMQDADAIAYATNQGVSSDQAKRHLDLTIQLFKELNLWGDLESAFLFGSNYQSSPTTLQSLNLARSATGVSTQGEWDAAFTGTTQGYLVANPSASTAVAAKTLIALYHHDGVVGRDAVISSRLPNPLQGMSLDGSGNGPTAVFAVYGRGTTAGSTPAVEASASDANPVDWQVICATLNAGTLRAMGGSVTSASQAVAGGTLWNNNSTWGIGKMPNGGEPFNGRLYFAAILNTGITPTTFATIRDGLERAFADVVKRRPAVIFDGNSLTGAATGGGTTWPQKLRLETGWDATTTTFDNDAVPGHKQIEDVEPGIEDIIDQWAPYADEDRLYILMSGTNDITAQTETSLIIASLQRTIIAMRNAGFRVVVCTIPPVADSGGGYVWNSTQQAARTAINAWIMTNGAALANQAVNLDVIAETYPLWLVPTDTTYYFDGLHHNDAGRQLIADYINDVVSYPVYDEF